MVRYDKCGRPYFELTDVTLYQKLSLSRQVLGLRVQMTLDLGNMRQSGDAGFCALRTYTEGTSYAYFEPLTFLADFAVSATSVGVTGAMIGVYRNAFGYDIVHLENLALSLALTAALGFPAMQVGDKEEESNKNGKGRIKRNKKKEE